MPIITNNMVSVACRIVYGRCWDNSAITTKERQNDMRRALRAALKQPVSENNMPPSDEVLLSSNESVAETIGWVLIDKNDVAVDFVGKNYDRGYGNIVARVAPYAEWANRRDKIFRGLAPHRIAAVYSAPQPPVDDALDECPNCVTPWKCNGPHIGEAPENGYENTARDAARYRWLRKHCGLSTLFLLEHRREPNEWDAEVDAAMAKDGAE